MIFRSKQLIVAWEHDFYAQSRHRSLWIHALRRRNVADGERLHRLWVRVSPFREPILRRPWISIEVIPAWMDVPSALAEYRRTMQPYEMPRTPWYMRQRRR